MDEKLLQRDEVIFDLNNRLETCYRLLERRNKAIDKLRDRIQELESVDPYEQYLHDVSRETVEEMQRDEREERCAVFTSRDVRFVEVQKGTATMVIHVQVSPVTAETLLIDMVQKGYVNQFEVTARDQDGDPLSWNASGVES